MKPFFIAFEGIDGCGKDTQMDKLTHWLNNHHKLPQTAVTKFQQPGSTSLGRELRALLLSKSVPMNVQVQLLLFTAARCNARDAIVGVMRAGSHVLTSRWTMSSIVYQGMMNKLGVELVQTLHNVFIGLNPDVTILLDLPAEVAMRRVADSQGMLSSIKGALKLKADEDRFESATLEVHDDRRRCYKIAAEDDPRAWIVDADQDPDKVFEAVLEAIGLKCERFKELL